MIETNITARFANQILSAYNNSTVILYFISSSRVSTIAYRTGNTIMAESEHYISGDDLNEAVPTFPPEIRIWSIKNEI